MQYKITKTSFLLWNMRASKDDSLLSLNKKNGALPWHRNKVKYQEMTKLAH